MICIYKITNTITGDFYIGQTINMHERELAHRREPQPKMREDVEKYGWDAFKFEIIEECSREELNDRESEKRLGVQLADEHKEILRQKSFGNKSRSKPVMCVETGKVYPNAKISAVDVGISPSAISCVLRDVLVTAGGLHFEYATKIQ